MRTHERRLGVLVGFTVLAACLFSAVCMLAIGSPETTLSHVLIAAASLGISDAPWLRLRVGHNQRWITLGTAGLLVALVAAPFVIVLALQIALTLVRYVFVLRVGLFKATFNAANEALSVSVAALVAGMPGHITGSAGLTRLAVGCLLASALQNALLAWVIATAQEMPYTLVLRQSLKPLTMNTLASVALGLVTVLLARHSPWTLLALPVVGLLLIAVQRGNVHRDQENDVWQQLSESARETESLEEKDIVPVALARVAALIRCDRVEMVLRVPGEAERSVAYSGGLRGLAESGTVVSPDIPVTDGELPTPEANGASTVVAVGLHGPDKPIGVLRAHFDKTVEVRERELQVLATYARNLGAAISSARMYAAAVREAQLKAWLAHHDNLTGLLNRPGLLALADEVTESVQANREIYALLVLDMDHFKQVNDTLGHDAGDRLLQHVSGALANRIRRGDIAARLEGDRFAVLLRHLPDDEMVEGIVTDILRTVSEPVEAEGGLLISLECSAGFAVSPVDGDSMDELLTHADVAAGQAKQSPGSSRRWKSETGLHRTRLALTADMRVALERGEQLYLHYQPKFDLATGAVTSVEALARWEHPERGRLSPAEFIPLAEQSGLARPFTLAVIEAAVIEAAKWRTGAYGDGEVSVAVNLSARNLLDRSLPDDVTRLCARHGFPTRLLVLEITETVVVSELEIVTEVLSQLRKIGVQLSVDDFGTGYSSLKFLQSIQVNELKIDKSFVDTMLTNSGDAAIVAATIDLGHRLGLRVVAEGVETEEQLDALTRAGCDAVQGFLLARPVPAAQLRDMLTPGGGVIVPLRPMRRKIS